MRSAVKLTKWTVLGGRSVQSQDLCKSNFEVTSSEIMFFIAIAIIAHKACEILHKQDVELES